MANEIRVGLKINGDNEVLGKLNSQVNSLNQSAQKLSGAHSQALSRIISKTKEVENASLASAEKIQKSFSGSTTSAGLFSTKLSGISLGVAGIGYGFKQVGDIVWQFFKSSVDEAAKFEKAMIGVTSVARNLGENTGGLKNVILDLTKDGLVPVTDAAETLKNLMASGLSMPQAINLFNSLKDAAAFNRQGQLSMGEAIVGASQGIKNQNSIMIDNAGITKNLSIIWKDYAASIGKSVGSLTDAEKAQAAYVGITKEALIFQGDAEKLTKTYSGSIDGLDASYTKLKISIGGYVTQSELVRTTINDIALSFDILAEKLLAPASNQERIASLKKESDGVEKLLEKYELLIHALPGGQALTGALRVYEIGQKMDLENLEEFEIALQNVRAKMKFNLVDPTDGIMGNDLTELLRGNGDVQKRLTINAKKQRDEQERLDQEARTKAVKKQEELYAELTKKYQDFNGDKVKELENAERRELAIAGNNEQLKFNIKQSFAQKVFDLEKKNSDKLNTLRTAQFEYEKSLQKEKEKAEKDRIRQIENKQKVTGEFFKNPFSTMERQRDQSDEDYNNSKLIGQVGGVANSVLGGKEGARSLISSGAASAADAFFPGSGQVIGPLISALSQGPEQTKAMVKEFTQAIPDLIEAIIASIPVVIEEFANQTPVIIERLVEKAPDIIKALVHEAPRVATALVLQMPRIGLAIIKEVPNMVGKFIEELVAGAGRFVQALVDKINPFDNNKGGVIGTTGGAYGGGEWDAGRVGTAVVTGGASEVWNTVTSWFANGGVMSSKGSLPLQMYSNGGIANKPQMAIFGEGRMNEAYVPLPDGKRIPVVQTGSNGQDNGPILFLLSEVLKLLQNPTTVRSSLNINNRAFGEIILELNRSNQRLV